MNLEEALEKYTHALTNGAGFKELRGSFVDLQSAHVKHSYGQWVNENGNVAEGAHNVD